MMGRSHLSKSENHINRIIIIAVITSLFLHFSCVRAIKTHAKGVVVSNGPPCAPIGASIFEKGGTAAEAAIAVLLCEGVCVPQTMGLGGGFIMTIFKRDNEEVTTLDAREVAPMESTESMFAGDAFKSIRGGLAVAVPGELKGYWYAYKALGGITPWRDLVQPSIDLCRKGVEVTLSTEKMLDRNSHIIQDNYLLREMFVNPETNATFKAGDVLKRLKLAETLEIIAEEGGDALHNGSLTENFVKDIENSGGIITRQDMTNYRPQWAAPIKMGLSHDLDLYTFPPPGSGVVLGFILNVLNGFLDVGHFDSFENWAKVIETFKFAYAKRMDLGDPKFIPQERHLVDVLTSDLYASRIRQRIMDNKNTFNDPKHYNIDRLLPDDHGTAHISILAPNGDAVAVTSTINYSFGAGIVSPSTGIILNNQMADFSSPEFSNIYDIPPSKANFIEPGKRAVSSMCPSIILKNNDVRMIIGAAGGPKITTSVAQVLMKTLWFNESLEQSIDEKRLHHQLIPMAIEYEDNFDDVEVLEGLKKMGHVITPSPVTEFCAVTAISRRADGELEGAYDPRRGGGLAYVYE